MAEKDKLGDKLIKDDLVSVRQRSSGILTKGPVLSTGNFWLDYISGTYDGFFPMSAITEVAALKGSGKTTICLETIAYNQAFNDNFSCLYMDFEKNLVRQQDLALGIGVDMSSPLFFYRQPNTLEGGCQFIIETLRPHTRKKWLGIEAPLDLIVIDTLAAARPKAEIDNKLGGTNKPGYRGKLWSEFFRNAQAELNNEGPAIVVINHLQQTIDLTGRSFGPPKYDSPGSNALKLYAAQRYFLGQDEFGTIKEEVTDPNTLEVNKQVIELRCKAECEKSKLGAPYRKTSYFILPGSGIDPAATMLEVAERVPGAIYSANNSVFGVPEKLGADKATCSKIVRGRVPFLNHLQADSADLKRLGANLNPLFEEQAKVTEAMRIRAAKLKSTGVSIREEGHELDESELTADLAEDNDL